MPLRPLAHRSGCLQPSPTVSIDARAKALIASGHQLYNLGVGEPHISTPEPARKGGIQAIEEHKTRYSHPAGLPQLREDLSIHLTQSYNFPLTAQQITLSSGAKQALFHALMLLLDPGDEVLIITPYWSTYPALVELLGAIPVYIQTSANSSWRPSVKDIENAITSQTKALIVCSPSNPTGEVYPLTWWEELEGVLTKSGIYIVSDEIYGDLIYPSQQTRRAPSPLDIPQLRSQTLLVHGFSKGHRMTGWRVGYLVTPSTFSTLGSDLQSQTSHHPSLPAQYAAHSALKEAPNSPHELMTLLTENLNLALSLINKFETTLTLETFNTEPKNPNNQAVAKPLLLHHLPQGAFYLFLCIEPFLNNRLTSSLRAAQDLLEKFKVVVMPGEAFGQPGYLRLSLAVAPNTLEVGLGYLLEYLRTCSDQIS